MFLKIIEAVVLIAALSAAGPAQTSEIRVHRPVEGVEKRVDPAPGFKSDGCSLFFDGNYRDCCVAHDLDYYKGGSLEERRASDLRLYKCVKRITGRSNKFIAPMMYVGVRIGGVSFLPTPFRWGFGRNKIKKALRMGDVRSAKQHNSPAGISSEVKY